MQRRWITTLLCGLIAFSAAITPANAGTSADATFATSLYQQLAKTKGNLLFSPFSIRTALGMAYAGAAGNTATQIRTVLGYPAGDQNPIAAFIGDVARQLGQSNPQYTLAVADALWGEKTFPFNPAFDNTLVSEFDAKLHRADFKTSPETARGSINGWVQEQTAGKIADLFPPGSIDSRTALVLANAVYFKADWETPFEPSSTVTLPFHLDVDHQADVWTMHTLLADVHYAETDALRTVELPYRGGLSMALLVPKAIDGLPGIEQKLDAKSLLALFATMQPRTVRLAMPRLKLNGAFTLSSALSALGMPDAFDRRRADFSGMIATGHESHPPLFVGQVLHRAVADVNEKGTEAAAATGEAMDGAAAMPVRRPLVKVFADRPFILLIRDPASGTILFMGRVSDPR